MPCFAANCAAVSSPRSASSATFALNSDEYLVRLPAIRGCPSLAQIKLNRLSEVRGPPQSYVQKSQAETSVLFELIAARYERRSLLITANQPFGAWESVFPDKAMTVAGIDRL
jgi:hypothetical protein